MTTVYAPAAVDGRSIAVVGDTCRLRPSVDGDVVHPHMATACQWRLMLLAVWKTARCSIDHSPPTNPCGSTSVDRNGSAEARAVSFELRPKQCETWSKCGCYFRPERGSTRCSGRSMANRTSEAAANRMVPRYRMTPVAGVTGKNAAWVCRQQDKGGHFVVGIVRFAQERQAEAIRHRYAGAR